MLQYYSCLASDICKEVVLWSLFNLSFMIGIWIIDFMRRITATKNINNFECDCNDVLLELDCTVQYDNFVSIWLM